MKKSLLTTSCLALTLALQAQITINSSDGPSVNTVIITAYDSVSTTGPGSAGASQTWDFSAWANHTTDTTVFSAPAGTPGAPVFTSSNLVIAYPADSTWIYFNNSSTGLTMDGYHLVDPDLGTLDIELIPSQIVVSYPSTYLTAYSNNSIYDIKFPYTVSPPIDSLRIKQTNIQDSEIDGYGTVITPAGTYTALRQNETVMTSDSIWYHAYGVWTFYQATADTSVNYRWWANGMGYSIAEIVTDNAGMVRSNSYMVATSASVNELSSNAKVTVYPNPANDQITIAGADNDFNLTITDISGRIIENRTVQNNSVTLDVSGYVPGNYFYTVKNKEGSTQNGKFIVAI